MTKKDRGFKVVEYSSLSNNQKLILKYLTEDFMTPQQIKNLKGISIQAVYKTINKLKQYGFLGGLNNGGFKTGGSYSLPPQDSNTNKTYRLHNIGLVVEILKSSRLYSGLIKKRNQDSLDNNTLMLYENNIVIDIVKDFWGDVPDDCVKLSLKYVERFIVRLENAYKIVLSDRSKCNIKQFKGHIAKVGDPYAKELNLSNDKLRIYDDLGELRLLVDKSFNYDELECVHSQKHRKDANSINDKWLDLLKTDLKLSDVEKHISQMQQYQIKNEEFKNELLIMLKAIIIKLDDKNR